MPPQKKLPDWIVHMGMDIISWKEIGNFTKISLDFYGLREKMIWCYVK